MSITKEQREGMTAIKVAANNLGDLITRECPVGPMKDKALIDLRGVAMFAIGSLFRDE